ncbi:MAG: hypothetical protein KatS3mg110_1964 [Pirellulaceae bacterium]|nr:MAG: hypothetical protein KatS3mg110_1964 [Pirellulaceae bacterium]
MKCRILARTVEGAFAWQADAWLALQLICCASAEPKTREHLADALRQHRPELRLWDHAHMLAADPPRDPPPVGAGECWCLVDYIGRTVVLSRTFPPLPDNSSIVQWKPSEANTAADWFTLTSESPVMGRVALLHLPPSWQWCTEDSPWARTVDTRYEQALLEPLIDIDYLLWGAPLFESIMNLVTRLPADSDFPKAKRQLHREWLCGTLPGLLGYPTCSVLWAGAWYAEYELELRQRLWITTGHRPQPLPASSPAFRFGPYAVGHHLLHYYLVQMLLEEAWHYRQKQGGEPNDDAWLRELERRAEAWWQEPFNDSLTGLTRREIWMRMRRRMPLTVNCRRFAGAQWPKDPSCQMADWAFECLGRADVYDELVDGYSAHLFLDSWFPWVNDQRHHGQPAGPNGDNEDKVKVQDKRSGEQPTRTRVLLALQPQHKCIDVYCESTPRHHSESALPPPWSVVDGPNRMGMVFLRNKPAAQYWVPCQVGQFVK